MGKIVETGDAFCNFPHYLHDGGDYDDVHGRNAMAEWRQYHHPYTSFDTFFCCHIYHREKCDF